MEGEEYKWEKREARNVTAILIRAKMRAGDVFAIGSDGKWPEWDKGRKLVKEIWHEKIWNIRSILSKRW